MIFFVFVTSFGFAMLAVGAAIADLWFRPAKVKREPEPEPRSSGQVGRKASRKSPHA